MRILILANNDVGLYKFRSELLNKLAESNEVFICLPNGEFVSELQKLGCTFLDCSLLDRHGTNPMQEIKLLSFYKKVISKINPDIVFTYTIKPNVYGGMACISLKIPYVANITGLGTVVENGGILQKITLILYKLGLRKAQKVFFQNSANRDFMLEHGVIKGEYDLLPGSGVNLEQHCFEEYSTDDGKLSFLFIGRLMKDKGVEELVRAAKIIKEKHDNVSFIVVGGCEKDYKKELETLEASKYVELAGFQSDVHSYIKNAHAVILPSYHEGMANVLLEGAACGRPVLATEVPGCRETFDEGVSGFGFKPRDIDSLCETIEKFITLPYEKKADMGHAGRAKMEKEFDRTIVLEKYMREIDKISKEK